MNTFADGATLQLFHVSDQEANTNSVDIAPQFSAVLNALRAEDIDADGVIGFDDTLTLSSGDVWIPGLFYDASESIFGAKGAADILIQNELGIQAVAFGNHEFDNGTGIIGELIAGFPTPDGALPFGGAAFPYLSSNLDFSGDANLQGLVTVDGQDAADIAGQIAASTVVETAGGMRVGVVGATTPTVDVISSPGPDIGIEPAGFDSGDPAAVAALAEVIQDDVDALLAANPDIDKVVLLAHMQQIAIEQQLAELLTDVDIIVAGGSNTRLFDETDVGFGGEPAQGVYPIIREGADGNPVAVVNTDFQYKYVGRLVIDFDENGVIIPDSYDPALSGAFATDAAGVERLGAAGFEDPEIVTIASLVEDTIIAGESEFFAVSTVFLNGERQGGGLDGVRTQETNLGNLTADANLIHVRDNFDDSVLVSIKNGGGIRANIGQIVVPGGEVQEPLRLPTEGVAGAKPDGGISVNDVANALSFNNGLVLLSLTSGELAQVLEHIVSEYSSLEVDSGMGQVGGVKFSFDPDLEPGNRIISAGIFDVDTGELVAKIVEDGEVVENPGETYRVVTLNFLADGGSGYPFPEFAATSDRVDLELPEDAPRTGGATFAEDGSEQDALAEYLLDNFGREPGDPTFDEADTPPSADERIQNLDFRTDTVFGVPEIDTLRVATFNASLNRSVEGQLAEDLATPDDLQAQAVAEIIQRSAPDILLVNEFDFDADGLSADLFRENYLEVGQNGADPIEYPFVYAVPSNTGVVSGFDLNNDGVIAGEADRGSFTWANDSQGFGQFPGQFGFVIFSKHEIDTANVRSFQNFLWQDMPDALLFETDEGRPLFDPTRPFDPANPDDPNTSFYTAEEAAALRLSSKSHVDVPIRIGDETIHVLAAHPTPPVFDGEEDRNGKRNFDEIRFWKDYAAGADYIYDDAGEPGGLAADASFVIVGDYNSDPFDGDSRPGAAQQLLNNPQIIGSTDDGEVTPASDGGVDAAERQGGANDDHVGNPAFDTADFNDASPGNLRVDYALPSAQGLAFLDGGVFWPTADDELFDLVGDFPFPSSDHRLVYVDVTFADDRRTVGPIDPARDGDFLGFDEIASGTGFAETVVGGLSGIAYDPVTGRYLAISDDRGGSEERGAPRFYELTIDLEDGSLDEGDVVIESVTLLTLADGSDFGALNPDPEGIAIGDDGFLYVSSERDLDGNPAIYRFAPDGTLDGVLPVDDKFLPNAAGTFGVRNNLGFESLTITPDGRTLYTATESALVQDGEPASLETGAAARIVKYDLATGQPVGEFVYEVEPIANAPVPADAFADSGLVELLAVDNQGTLLALERSFSAGAPDRGFTGKLFLVETQAATDVIGRDSIPTSVDDGELEINVDEVVRKELLLDLGDLGIDIDNIEGLALGPVLDDGRQSLIIASDDNFGFFGPQANQFIAVALDIDPVPTIEPVAETPDELRYPGPEPIVIAHRGASGELPEHTLGAYGRAINDGADFIEPDLVTTADGVLIARHEPYLARVELDADGNIVFDDDGNPIITFASTNVAELDQFRDKLTVKETIPGFQTVGGWFAEDFTLAEIKELRAREDQPELRPQAALFDDVFEIPTLDEIIDLVKRAEETLGKEIGVYPETKGPSRLELYGRFQDEDANGNGVLDDGEDLNGNGTLDQVNGGALIGIDTSQVLIDTLVANGFTDPDRVFIQSFEIANLLELQEEIMPAAGVDLPLVQLIGSTTFPTVDIIANFLLGLPNADPSIYDSLGGLVDANTTGADLVTPEGLATLAEVYAEGIGPSLGLVFNEALNLVANAQDAGLLVHTYTHRDETVVTGPDGEPLSPAEFYSLILETGVDGVFTDNPATGRAATDAIWGQEGADPDDPAIWLNPADADASVVITAMKEGGLRVYDLAGGELQRLTPDGIRYNNVDVLYGVSVGDAVVDLAVASDRANDTLAIFEIDAATGLLTDVTADELTDDAFSIFGVDDGEATAYGLTTYRSIVDGKLYAFTTQADGSLIAQLELMDGGDGTVTAEVVRTIELPVADGDDPADYQSEGIAVDRETGIVYVTVEDELGVVRFGAEPTDPATVEVIVDIDEPFFTPDLEGIAILYGKDGAGALVVSSQGDATFAVFDRQTYDHLGSFAIGPDGDLDGVEESDGLEIFAAALGDAFPHGLLVTQDGSNEPQAVFGDPEDGEVQNFNVNFKFSDLGDVVTRLDLPTPDAEFDPRAVVSAGTDGNDLLIVEEDGAAILLGGEGNDRLIGGDTFAVLRGDAGRDTLQAGTGGARLVGGADRDALIGDVGPDTFVLDGDGPDYIRGFDAGADLIELAIAGVLDVELVDAGRNQVLNVDTGGGFETVATILGGGADLDAVVDPFIG